MSDVTVGILTFNQLDLTLACLRSYEAQGWPVPVRILDNGTGSDADALTQAFHDRLGDGLEIYSLKENLGVSGGRNFLAERIDSTWVWFVDNDTLFTDELGEFLEDLGHRSEDLIYLMLLDSRGLVLSSGGRYRRILSWSSRGFHNSERSLATQDMEAATDWGTGGVLCIRGAVFNSLGGFDQAAHGIYGSEDIDLCLRARKEGYRAVRVAFAPVIHLGGGHSIGLTERRAALKAGTQAIQRRHGLPLTRPLAALWYRLRRIEAFEGIKQRLKRRWARRFYA
jgi:GT2 family glycosyltransferase